MNPESRIFVTGHKGLVGSSILRTLTAKNYRNILTIDKKDCDLREQRQTREYFKSEQPDFVIHAAGKVGGIIANSQMPADFLYENAIMALNVLDSCRLMRVSKTLVLGSSCIYPKMATQPILEDSLLTGPLEPTNEWYAIAKIMGIKLGQALRKQHNLSIISAMPTNLYGINDNFDPVTSHVLPALVRKMHDAKVQGQTSVTLWGSGEPRREFLYVDDLSDACVFLMNHYDSDQIINIGYGRDTSIRNLAEVIQKAVGYSGSILWDTNKPDGTPRKLMDSGRLRSLGWQPKVGLQDGIEKVYEWFRKQQEKTIHQAPHQRG